MATKTFEELKQLAIQIRDEKTNKQNTATRVGTAMLEHINKLEQDYYDKTQTDEELKERDDKLTEIEYEIVYSKNNILEQGGFNLDGYENDSNIRVRTKPIKNDFIIVLNEKYLINTLYIFNSDNTLKEYKVISDYYVKVEKGTYARLLISNINSQENISINEDIINELYIGNEVEIFTKKIQISHWRDNWVDTNFGEWSYRPGQNDFIFKMTESTYVKLNPSKTGLYLYKDEYYGYNGEKLYPLKKVINISLWSDDWDTANVGEYIYRPGQNDILLKTSDNNDYLRIDFNLDVVYTYNGDTYTYKNNTIVKVGDDIIYGKNYIINSELTQNTEAGVSNIRCTERFIGAGKIKKIYIKNTLTEKYSIDIIREQYFYIVELKDNRAIIKHKFSVKVKGTAHEYINGIDFNIDYIVSNNEVLGFYNETHKVYFQEVPGAKSIVLSGELNSIEEGNEYTYVEQENIFSLGYELDGLSVYNNSLEIKELKDVAPIQALYKIPNVDTLRVDADNYNCIVKTNTEILDGSKIILVKGTTEWVSYLALKVDFKNGKIGFLSSYKGTTENYISSENFTSTPNTKYYIENIKTVEGNYIGRITNMFTLETVEITVSSSTSNMGIPWGLRRYINVDCEVLESNDISSQPFDSIGAIIGDSFIEGNSIPADKNKRYCYLMLKKLNGKLFICAQGGGISEQVVSWINDYLRYIVNPKYVILAMGMNDSNYDKWLSNTKLAINTINAIWKNVKILFVTIPPAGSNYANAEHIKMNDWIRSSGYTYLDVAEILSLNYDGVTLDTSKLLEDQVHPTIESHELIYKRSLIDFAEMYAEVVK